MQTTSQRSCRLCSYSRGALASIDYGTTEDGYEVALAKTVTAVTVFGKASKAKVTVGDNEFADMALTHCDVALSRSMAVGSRSPKRVEPERGAGKGVKAAYRLPPTADRRRTSNVPAIAKDVIVRRVSTLWTI